MAASSTKSRRRATLAAALSAASRVPSTYSPARTSISSRSVMAKTIPQLQQAATQPGFDRRRRARKVLTKRHPAHAFAIREQHEIAPVAVEGIETLTQTRELLALLNPIQGMLLPVGQVHDLRGVLDGNCTSAPHLVEGSVARDRHHPCDRSTFRRVVVGGPFPDLHVDLLQNFIGNIVPAQNAKD